MVMRIGIVYYEEKTKASNSTTSHIYSLSLEHFPYGMYAAAVTSTFHTQIQTTRTFRASNAN